MLYRGDGKYNMIDIIKGGIAKDHRGHIRFVNDLDMTDVKRFYIINNANTEYIRGWRGHRIERRWFYVLAGSFEVSIVKIDDWDNPSPELAVEFKILKAQEMQVLYIPAGHATAVRAIENNNELLVFADYGLEHAQLDDYTWPAEYFLKNTDV